VYDCIIYILYLENVGCC